MDELRIDFELGDLEEIEKLYGSKFKYPVVHIGNSAVFNARAERAGIVGEAVKWFVTPEYVIGIPAKKNSTNAFSAYKTNYNGASVRFPSMLRDEKKVATGYYKLLKYKNGFAFKRYEPLEVD